MKTSHHLTQQAVLDTWDYLNSHPLSANACRIAFADPEFMLRREARGIRMQLELLKPELDQKAQGIENTVVVFGSARFCSMEEAITPREKRIMELRYLKGKTQMEVAREIGISQAQVSRLEKAALEQFHQMT